MPIGPDKAAQLWHQTLSQREAVGKYNHQTEFQAKDGFGGEHISIPLNDWCLAQIEENDMRIWQDQDFMKRYKRNNPHCVQRASRGTRGQEYAGTRHLTQPLPKGTIFVPPQYAK